MKKWMLLGGVVALCGCSGADEGGDPSVSSKGPQNGDVSAKSEGLLLPTPSVRRVAIKDFNPAARQRATEIDRFIAKGYRGFRIVDTVETYSGDVIDYVDPATVPGSTVEPPPKLTKEELATPPGVELQPTEVETHPELRGPAGSIPFVRPRFDAYLNGESTASSLTEHVAQLQARKRALPVAAAAAQRRMHSGQPAGVTRLYGGYLVNASNTRMVGWVNEFGGTIDSGTFSLLETATTCVGSNSATTLELVGTTISRDRTNFSDSVPRIRVEFMTAGLAQGNNVGGWDGLVSGFVAASGRPYGPGAAVTPSTIDGTQYESRFELQLSGGNWWISHNNNWLGYYPGSLFNLINTGGCQAHWYGEVYDPTPTSWTNTNMGSGLFASQGFGKAAYYRDAYYVDPANVSHWLESANGQQVGPVDTHCYTTTLIASAAAPWERSFFLGGPGGEAAGCD